MSFIETRCPRYHSNGFILLGLHKRLTDTFEDTDADAAAAGAAAAAAVATKTPSATSNWEIISTDRKVFLCPPELLKAA